MIMASSLLPFKPEMNLASATHIFLLNTFNNTRGQKFIIDIIRSNRGIKPTQVLDVRTLTSATLGTQHNLVLSKIIL